MLMIDYAELMTIRVLVI